MKHIVLVAISLVLIFGSCTQQDNPTDNSAAIRKAVSASFTGLAAAAKSLDSQKYFSFFDRNKFTSLNEDGTVTHSFGEFEKSYLEQTATIAKYNSLEFENVKITVVDEHTAILVNTYKAVVQLKSGVTIKASGAGTQVWSGSNQTWKLVNVSSSAGQ